MKLKNIIISAVAALTLGSTLAEVGVGSKATVDAASINSTAQTYSYVGTSYLYKILKAAGITYNKFYKDNKITYRKGKPEGIVVHETADSGATAYNEAIFFNREWENISAYVHAFVDDKQVIQMMTTKYGVWGAGAIANKRFIQVELAEVSTRAKFAKSVNNDAIYIARLLHQWDLKPNDAHYDGKGTIWSHYAVSKYLGGTDHSDPVGYFSKWGYTFSQFYQLIKYYYNLQGATTNTTSSSSTSKTSSASSSSKASVSSSSSKTSSSSSTSSKSTQAPKATVVKKTLKHNAYIYTSTGKRTKTLKRAGTTFSVTGTKTIKGRKYYHVGKNKYVVASNIDGTRRTLKHNAYVYDTVGFRKGTTVLKKGKRVRTYGGRVKIGNKYYYQTSVSTFVKAGNF